jgi:hypothetical protein
MTDRTELLLLGAFTLAGAALGAAWPGRHRSRAGSDATRRLVPLDQAYREARWTRLAKKSK